MIKLGTRNAFSQRRRGNIMMFSKLISTFMLFSLQMMRLYVEAQAVHVPAHCCCCYCCDSLGWDDVPLLDVLHNFVQQCRMRLRPSTLRPTA
jgi:hypothetical protein